MANMSLAQKNNWRPNATLEALRCRAALLSDIRTFFQERGVIEVETPLLCHAATNDPHLHPIPALYTAFGAEQSNTLYLQTSPEFAMKRLLAFGIGPIYQLCKAFRNGETGKIHNPEFTILEWYQPGYDHHQLMSEVDIFLQSILKTPPASRITYQQLFLDKVGLDPLNASLIQLQEAARDIGVAIDDTLKAKLGKDDWLDLLLSHEIEPELGFAQPVIVYDFPESQAALAKIRPGNPGVAERFEVYVNGLELANGYHELTDGEHQYERLKRDSQMRVTLNHPEIPIDMNLVEALRAGMPDCAGVALGVDRLLMAKLGKANIEEVVSFTIDRA
jgi:lysyl-tRNA synthetase class 2